MQFSSFRPSHLFGAIAVLGFGIALLIWSPWSAQARSAAFQTSNVAMNCAPGQQAIVRQQVVSGELNVSVDCSAAPAGPALYNTGLQQPVAFNGQAPALIPAVYRSSDPAPTRAYTPRRTTTARPVARSVETSGRDWKREALIIGGSTGAGAGIGGLIGGKKGALIGAAIGGGGAALYRATKK
jgi:hypothetical protein